MITVDPWLDQVGPVVRTTPWLVAMDHLVNGCGVADFLERHGAPPSFVLAGSRGTGPVDEDRESLVLGLRADSMLDGIRAQERALASLAPSVVERLDRWDPPRAARVWRPFFSDGSPVAGRRTFGARPPAWQALEDKTVIDALWQAIGVPHAPHRIVAPTLEALSAALTALDRGDGVVVSGDNREGFNGGAACVRWVTDTDLPDAVRFFAARCDRVRVMPFLEGRPCSIHAFVTAEGTAVFRPCEMLVARDARRFVYLSAATFWNCPEPHATRLRDLARRVAAHLSDTLGYRGVFTLDGVLTADGFRPTELNPRLGAALFHLTRGSRLPLEFLHYAAVEGLPLQFAPKRMETFLMDWSEHRRSGRAGLLVADRPTGSMEVCFERVGDGLRRCEPGSAHFTATYGPATSGGYLGVIPSPGRLQPGPAFAPVATAWLGHAARHFGIRIPKLSAAPDRISAPPAA